MRLITQNLCIQLSTNIVWTVLYNCVLVMVNTPVYHYYNTYYNIIIFTDGVTYVLNR